mmetsp:Transcript_54174/g.162198  ORF Transcript_54174/g.162198 Transcript_54174/m.162198 type:complete len:204 (-) Transcript_54174:18-629(-)
MRVRCGCGGGLLPGLPLRFQSVAAASSEEGCGGGGGVKGTDRPRRGCSCRGGLVVGVRLHPPPDDDGERVGEEERGPRGGRPPPPPPPFPPSPRGGLRGGSSSGEVGARPHPDPGPPPGFGPLCRVAGGTLPAGTFKGIRGGRPAGALAGAAATAAAGAGGFERSCASDPCRRASLHALLAPGPTGQYPPSPPIAPVELRSLF